MRRALPILINILEKETRGWFLHFRERLIAELRAQKLPDHDIERVSTFYCTKYKSNHILFTFILKKYNSYIILGSKRSCNERISPKSL